MVVETTKKVLDKGSPIAWSGLFTAALALAAWLVAYGELKHQVELNAESISVNSKLIERVAVIGVQVDAMQAGQVRLWEELGNRVKTTERHEMMANYDRILGDIIRHLERLENSIIDLIRSKKVRQ